MIQTKICGITKYEDALCAERNGAAAVGFIFYAPSPRYIEPAGARAIIDRLPRELVKVGVFVNETAAEVKRIYDFCGLDMIQLHGDESSEYCRQFPKDRLIKALNLKSDGDLKKAAVYEAAAILVDSRRAGLYGGTGQTADWDLASHLSQPMILSGGLNEENVADAIKKVHPSALDIASGVESAAGRKDHEKIARIMRLINKTAAAFAASVIFTRKETL